jgi:hypothetical protein
VEAFVGNWEKRMKYFAYGSNMLTQRLVARVSSASNPVRLVLSGYQLRFHKKSIDGSGKCNIVRTGLELNVVHGVLFDISEDQLPQLDDAEGCGHGYHCEQITLAMPGHPSQIATVYIADVNVIDDALIPYRWYFDLVVAGAEQHELPLDYISAIRSVPFTADPKPDRKTKLEAEEAFEEYARSKLA